ncbi:amidophosphoribosyltransferase [Ammoniphilus oxalaticus]|uniref:Amidophosphoribosyltransferase n=1 Tax=Ammoniphilus oxalaticus TaxID=66863 RepID=A0A419SDA1_9BACL|nr:amidophosphoribosyltransferase [Ammoniphilus oxalaticus]RKD21089.1 amidophosphoribosyltransferase [Ammoniphilus oxalaticus]
MSNEVIWDKLNEECGIFGVYGHPDAPQLSYYGIHSLQHRGQESAGICAADGKQFKYHRGMGLVTEAFGNNELEQIDGHLAIGHVRYTTAGNRKLEDAQPLIFKYSAGNLALAHNGNIVNAKQIKHQLERQGSIFQTTSDTEVIAHLIARSGYERIEDAARESLRMIKGAYALLIMTENKLIAALDPNGLRPLSIGTIGDGYVLSSETCAFDVIGAEYLREVQPGELVIIDEHGIHSERISGPTPRAICSFEYIYFARPDSDIDQINVHQARKQLGRQLALEAPVEADVVTGVPDSSISAAIGYAEATGIPYELGLIKNRYVGRTFIQPSQELRAQGVRMKLSVVRKVVEGKRVVMIDDSIVRGTTCNRIVRMLREAGAKEVHVRISSPPVKNPCFYGIDTSDREGLIAAQKTLDQMCEYIGADSLAFLSVEGLVEGIGRDDLNPNRGHCLACFTGQYPTEIYEDADDQYASLV